MKKIVIRCATIGALTLCCVLLRGQNPLICQPPIISTQPADQSLYQFQNLNLVVAVDLKNSTLPLSYQWSRNGVSLADSTKVSGSITPTLTVFEVGTSDAGGYTVTVANSCQNGTVTSSSATVSVTPVDDPGGNRDQDDADNQTELLQGRNFLTAIGTASDNRVQLQVYTPLK